jgi:hypothetical protein
VNIMQFCKEYNAATQDKVGMIIPVEISVYEDRSFTFVLKTPPASGEAQYCSGVPRTPLAAGCCVRARGYWLGAAHSRRYAGGCDELCGCWTLACCACGCSMAGGHWHGT